MGIACALLGAGCVEDVYNVEHVYRIDRATLEATHRMHYQELRRTAVRATEGDRVECIESIEALAAQSEDEGERVSLRFHESDEMGTRLTVGGTIAAILGGAALAGAVDYFVNHLFDATRSDAWETAAALGIVALVAGTIAQAAGIVLLTTSTVPRPVAQDVPGWTCLGPNPPARSSAAATCDDSVRPALASLRDAITRCGDAPYGSVLRLSVDGALRDSLVERAPGTEIDAGYLVCIARALAPLRETRVTVRPVECRFRLDTLALLSPR